MSTSIFHITNVVNLNSILNLRGLWCDRERLVRCPNAVNIAYQDLKGRRSQTRVHVGPRGNLCDYVPFYFAPRSPMLFVISQGLVPNYNGGQRGVIYLVSSCESVREAGLGFVFTDGHAVKRLTCQFDDLDKLSEIDWPLMQATYWNDTDQDGDRKRRRQAEFLVLQFFPWELIETIGVYDAQQADIVRNLLKSKDCHRPSVKVRPGWYY